MDCPEISPANALNRPCTPSASTARRTRRSRHTPGVCGNAWDAEILIKEPKVIFLDEPTLGLDPDATNRMMALIQQLCQEKHITIVLSSHLLYQAQKICHRVGIMLKGRIVAQGAMEQLAAEKFGVDGEQHTLEAIYLRYFQEV
jgi:ABC-2 type transport system ATP-binding protein